MTEVSKKDSNIDHQEKAIPLAPRFSVQKLFAVIFCAFVLVVWPIVEFVYYAQIPTLCRHTGTSTTNDIVDFGGWLLANALISSLPILIPVAIFTMCCGICVCCFCDEGLTNDFLKIFFKKNQDGVQELRPTISFGSYIVGLVIHTILGVIGIFAIISLQSWTCQPPIIAIFYTSTTLRFILLAMCMYKISTFKEPTRPVIPDV